MAEQRRGRRIALTPEERDAYLLEQRTVRVAEPAVRLLGEVVEEVHVGAELVGGASEGPGDPRPELLLEQRQHGVPHAREARTLLAAFRHAHAPHNHE